MGERYKSGVIFVPFGDTRVGGADPQAKAVIARESYGRKTGRKISPNRMVTAVTLASRGGTELDNQQADWEGLDTRIIIAILLRLPQILPWGDLPGTYMREAKSPIAARLTNYLIGAALIRGADKEE